MNYEQIEARVGAVITDALALYDQRRSLGHPDRSARTAAVAYMATRTGETQERTRVVIGKALDDRRNTPTTEILT